MPDGNIIRSAGNLKISSRKYLRSRFNVCLSLFSLERCQKSEEWSGADFARLPQKSFFAQNGICFFEALKI